uniref:Uncharacterized protein n=1 Tax=Graphocephala atropunctata TaxID=36148 RepID=A0A1B6LHM7_9HEMI
MPSKTKHKILQTAYVHRPGSKIILIEQTTWLSIFAFILFKSVIFIWPEDVWNLSEMLLALPSVLRTYPVFTGALFSFLTWHIMYLDSAVPGINPPTPLSPSKYREVSGADFHINYVFALLVGPLATALLYMGWA